MDTNGQPIASMGQTAGSTHGAQAGANGPGTETGGNEVQRAEALHKGPGRASERILDAKAARHIAGKYRGFNLWAIEFLAALSMYLYFMNREGIGAALDSVVDWSGARARWEKKMKEGYREALNFGAVERFKAPGGHAIDITDKGRRILEDYNRKFEELRQIAEEKKRTTIGYRPRVPANSQRGRLSAAA